MLVPRYRDYRAEDPAAAPAQAPATAAVEAVVEQTAPSGSLD